MRYAITLAAAAASLGSLCGQSFVTCGSNICTSPPGVINVGIGTQSPASALVINAGANADAYLGNNIANGRGQLRLFGKDNYHVAVLGNEYWDGSNLRRVTAGGGGDMLIDNSTGATAGDISFDTWPNGAQGSVIPLTGTTTMIIKNSGNVGIGTTSPVHTLHVAGTIGAEEVIVSSTGADYVFQPGYRLRPLAEIGEYIKQHQHLPDLPSAQVVRDKGVSLGEMQTKRNCLPG